MTGFPIGNRLRAPSMVRLTLVAAVSPTGQRDVSAATLFVSPAGDDRATGTDSDPLQTISKAADRAQPGDTILVRAGVHRERVTPPRGREPGKPIVYRSEGELPGRPTH